MSDPRLTSEYFALYRLTDAMDRLLRECGVDICGGACGGTCPLCMARKRFRPKAAPRNRGQSYHEG